MKKNYLKITLLGCLSMVFLGMIVGKQIESVRGLEVKGDKEKTEMTPSSSQDDVEGPFESKTIVNRDINDSWPGQTMMKDEYGLEDNDWEVLPLTNNLESLSTFPINVEGFEEAGLVGHIRFGGVTPDGNFIRDKNKQLRNLIFVVENTKKFVATAQNVTAKYTYNYYQGTNNTYSMIPITETNGVTTAPQDPYYMFEGPQGGSDVNYRTVTELYRQETKQRGVYAIQARTKMNDGLGNLDFYFQQIKTLVPTLDGGVRIVNEVKNTGWRAGKENAKPRKTFGAVIGEDTMLNDVDKVPIFSLGTNKGVYIANKEDLFRVSFPRVGQNDGAATNYEGQSFNSVFGSTYRAFQGLHNGLGNESQDLKLDQRVWPFDNKYPPLLPNDPKLPIDERGYDTQYVQKWTPREPPEVGEKAIMSYDVAVLPIHKPEIRLSADSIDQNVYKEEMITFKGDWRDLDSLNVTLYYKIGSQATAGWVEFATDSREDHDDLKEVWRPFKLDLPGTKFKLGEDTIEFKAVDTTRVDSDVVKTTVRTFETVTIKTEHYGPKGELLKEVSEKAIPGDWYTTTDLDFTVQGLTLDASKTEGIVEGTAPKSDVLVSYHYKKGLVRVVTHYLKEDGKRLFDSTEIDYGYNQSYQTDSQEMLAKTLDYYLQETEGSPAGSTGTVDKTIEITYRYRIGVLGLVEAIETVDFGTQKLITGGSKDIYPEKNMTVEVLDELKGNWLITLRVSDSLKTTKGREIKGDLFFKNKEADPIKLTGSAESIYAREELTGGRYKIEWDASKKQGVFFRQEPGNLKETYTGELEWNLVDAL